MHLENKRKSMYNENIEKSRRELFPSALYYYNFIRNFAFCFMRARMYFCRVASPPRICRSDLFLSKMDFAS